MRKIYLAQHNESLFLRAVQLLGKAVISYRASEYWVGVREQEYLRALVILKNNDIATEIGNS